MDACTQSEKDYKEFLTKTNLNKWLFMSIYLFWDGPMVGPNPGLWLLCHGVLLAFLITLPKGWTVAEPGGQNFQISFICPIPFYLPEEHFETNNFLIYRYICLHQLVQFMNSADLFTSSLGYYIHVLWGQGRQNNRRQVAQGFRFWQFCTSDDL